MGASEIYLSDLRGNPGGGGSLTVTDWATDQGLMLFVDSRMVRHRWPGAGTLWDGGYIRVPAGP